MLAEVAQALDDWVLDQNAELRAGGLPLLKACDIKVFGQAALLEHKVPLRLTATKDVDARGTYEYVVEQQFRVLLKARGWELDAVAHEAWMPRETLYLPEFSGRFVTLRLAEPEAIILSKALKAPVKNRALVTEYLALGASERFLKLAQQYRLDLEPFL